MMQLNDLPLALALDLPFVIAQADAGPPMAGTPTPTSTVTAPGGAVGAPGAAGQPAPRGGVDIITVMMIGLVIAMVVSIFLGGRREKKKFEQMMASMKKHDQVRTVGGIIGSIVEIKPDVVVLKVDENSNTKITVARSKIEAVLKESTQKDSSSKEASSKEASSKEASTKQLSGKES